MTGLRSQKTWWSAAKISLLYALFGGLWILLSDKALNAVFLDAETLSLFQTYKGWFFIIVTASALYFLVRLATRRTERIEAAGIATGERYDELVENAIDCIFTLDTNGYFTAANRAVEKLTGYRRDEILALNFADILAPEFKDYVDRLLDPQNTQNPTSVKEVRIIRRDGREAFLEISSRPLSLKDRDRVLVENIARDVTQRHIMQAELSEAKHRYEMLIEAANEGIWTVDADFRVTLVNRKLCDIVGRSADQLIGRRMHEFLVDTDIETKADELFVPHSEADDHFEFELTRPDGTVIAVLVSSNPLLAGGDFQGVVYLATDITERRKGEELLRQSEERFRAMFEQSPIAAAIIGYEGEIIECNRVGTQLLGYERDELLKLSIRQIDVNIIADPSSARTFGDDQENPHRFQFETQHLRKDGEIRDVLVAASQIELGGVFRELATWLDITEYKNASRSLQRSEERLQALYKIIADPEPGYVERIERILELGARELGSENAVLGHVEGARYSIAAAYSVTNKIGIGFTCPADETLCRVTIGRDELLALEDVAASEWRDHAATKRFSSRVYLGMPVTCAGQTYGTICFTALEPREKKFTRGDREFVKLMAQWISSELTRQQAEEALRQSEERLLQAQKLESVGRLAGGIAHDFNNMLTAINGYSDLTLSRMKSDDPLRHNLNEIKKAGERSTALTQQLLAFSRKQILKPETRNINETVAEVTSLLERLIGEDIRLETNLDAKLRPAEVDNSKLSQVIVNLAVNARDAMPNGGTLKIETRNVFFDDFSQPDPDGKVGHYVVLSVSDTGVGMDEETQRQLFEPFFTTKDVGKGTGLGLATAYGFIKQSGGFIKVDSSPGAGSTFNVYLPSAESESEQVREEKRGESDGVAGEVILLVEDEEIVRSFATEVLESRGYKVIATGSGDEALRLCDDPNLRVDLLLTDVVMPQMGGRELWEKLSAKRTGMKVIFTSGYTDDTVVRSGISEDGANFLQKPFLIDALTHKVREVLDSEIHTSGIDRN